MKLTMRDIAKRAGVSPATVSNALNGRGGVSKALQEQVLSIAKEMGYQPAREAKKPNRHVRLIIYKSHGQVVMDTPFFSELTEGVQLECRRAGMELLISHVDAKNDPEYISQIRSYCTEECNGILLLGTEMNEKELSQFSNLRAPLVVLDNIFQDVPVHSVVMDNFQAGHLAAETLYSAGHRQIGHITSSVTFSNMTDRLHGFRERLHFLGVDMPDEWIWRVRPTINGAYEDMKALLKQGSPLPTAFFVGNDIMAIGCMRALSEAGMRTPEDVSIIGMDNTALCEACTPKLSTIHVYKRDFGILATRTLLSLTDGATSCPIKVKVGVQVKLRDSIRQITPNEQN